MTIISTLMRIITGTWQSPTMPDATNALTLQERAANLREVYVEDRGSREVRETAVGWQPGADWTEAEGKTPSGNREYHRVVKKGN